MEQTVIGVDPHKRSHTAVVLDDNEDIAAQRRVGAHRRQAHQLVSWAQAWPHRYWVVENASGWGRLLAQQLVAAGETVVDVPASLSSRARKLSGRSARKTDDGDARSVAIAACHHRQLQQVAAEDLTAAVATVVQRRRQLVAHRHRIICHFHQVLAELTAGGAPRHLSVDTASELVGQVRPSGLVDAERRQTAEELVADWRWATDRIATVERRLRDLLAAHGTTLTELHGIAEISAATIISIVGDPRRFPDKGHFAAYHATAPVEASSGDVARHRVNRGGRRDLNAVLDTAAKSQIRDHAAGRAYYDRKLAEGKTHDEALRSLKRQLSDAVYRRLRRDTSR